MTPKPLKFIKTPLGLASLLVIGLVLANVIFLTDFLRRNQADQGTLADPETITSTITQITALGRLEPEGEIIELSAPESGQRLKQWQVKAGDTVQADQIVAVMYGVNQSQAAVDNAQAKVAVAEARLGQIRAGEEPARVDAQQQRVSELQAQLTGDLDVQKTVVARRQAELDKAEVDFKRFSDLYEAGGAVSSADVEEKRLQREISREQLQEALVNTELIQTTGRERVDEAEATLASLTDVFGVDVTVAEAELTEAISVLKQAEADLEALYVRSPIEGQVLSLNTKVGEVVSSEGLATIGQTQQMYVIAEVYESDIRYIEIGQPVTVTSEFGGFEGELQGTVERIGLQIEKPGIVNNDPEAQADVRVVKVFIALDPADSERVRTLNKLQVIASIQV
ncbi:MAG: HlyD family efflux transporter periplasmic adaptor subunit [Cyanobacteria bacterium P01_H01_bin.121]